MEVSIDQLLALASGNAGVAQRRGGHPRASATSEPRPFDRTLTEGPDTPGALASVKEPPTPSQRREETAPVCTKTQGAWAPPERSSPVRCAGSSRRRSPAAVLRTSLTRCLGALDTAKPKQRATALGRHAPRK